MQYQRHFHHYTSSAAVVTPRPARAQEGAARSSLPPITTPRESSSSRLENAPPLLSTTSNLPLTHPNPPASFWKGKSSEAELVAALNAVDAEAWAAQRAAGIAKIALDGTAYDQVLDMVYALGLAPARFQVGGRRVLGVGGGVLWGAFGLAGGGVSTRSLPRDASTKLLHTSFSHPATLAPSPRPQHLSGLDLYFAMARGAPGAPALDMSKFFDSNYHFMVGTFCAWDFTSRPPSLQPFSPHLSPKPT
jgi:hypothetical protein